jgi:hypothetical protein
MRKNESSPAPQKRNAPLWVKFFVPLHILAITAWALPFAPDQFMPFKHAVKKGDGFVVVHDDPRVPLHIRTDNVSNFFRSSSQYFANEPLVLNELYGKDSILKFYLLTTGFWQYWDMFSPNPANTDAYCDAIVTYKDGSTKPFLYPRIHDLSIPMKYLKERYRKYFERAGSSRFSYTWPYFAQRIARLSNDSPNNPPTEIRLHIHKHIIAPPGQPENVGYSDEEYYRYQVTPKDLSE